MRRATKSGALVLASVLSLTGSGTTRAQDAGGGQPAASVPQTNTAVFIVEGMT
jgi:hypothetical protein